MKLSNVPISRKLILAFAVVLLAIGGMGGTIFLQLESLKQADAQRDAGNKLVQDVSAAEFSLARQENSLRGFLVSADPYYLERLDSHRANFKAKLDDVRVGGDAEVVTQVNAAEAAADAWYDRIVTQGSALAANPATRAEAAALVGNDGEADQLIAPVEAAMENLHSISDRMLESASAQQNQATATAMFSLIAGFAAAILIAIAASILLTRAVVKPLVGLTDAMGALVQNRLDGEIVGRDRGDEIGAMARALVQFKQNADLLDASRAEAWNDAFKSAAFEGSPTAMMTIDRDFKVLHVNSATKKLLAEKAQAFRTLWTGFDPEKILGQSIDVFPRTPNHQRQLLSDPSRLPHQAEIKVGDLLFDLTISAVRDRDGNYIGNALQWQDVTELRAKEAEVADVVAQLTAAGRAQAIIEFDLSGKILTANENFLKVVGYSLEEVQGRHHSMFVDKEYGASAEYQAFWRRLNSGEFIVDKFTRYGRGGARAVIEASYNPILDANGKPYKVVKFATDVTQVEKEREERLEADRRAAEIQARVVAETGRGLSALAAGKLAHRINADFPGDYAALKSDFNDAMGKLEDAMGVITNNALAMQTGAGEISQAADDLSRRTEQQAATLEETAAALDEITATVRRTAEGAQRANVVVTDARSDAEVSGNVVAKAITAMGEIEASADQISQIIGVIDEIAFQTNLLALNAGVEAARAGDAGRGFAVVASEVRALAQRSAEAAKEIKTLISASTAQVKDGVSLVGQTGQALTAIVGRVSEINALMAEINASAQEQATALSQVNTAVNQMDQTTQQNAAMVEESTAASHNLTQEAAELARLVGRFEVGNQRPVEASADRHRAAPSPARAAQARVSEFASRQSAPRSVGNTALAVDSWEEF